MCDWIRVEDQPAPDRTRLLVIIERPLVNMRYWGEGRIQDGKWEIGEILKKPARVTHWCIPDVPGGEQVHP